MMFSRNPRLKFKRWWTRLLPWPQKGNIVLTWCFNTISLSNIIFMTNNLILLSIYLITWPYTVLRTHTTFSNWSPCRQATRRSQSASNIWKMWLVRFADEFNELFDETWIYSLSNGKNTLVLTILIIPSHYGNICCKHCHCTCGHH